MRSPQGLALKVMPCGLFIRSDPRLLEQMVRNLLSNALKYTQRGRVLVGCRRRPGKLRIEIWDTGLGIPASELEAIFEEYHQVDNPARERSRGPGFGALDRQEPWRLVGASDSGALAAGQGLGILDRGPHGVGRRGRLADSRSHSRPAGRGPDADALGNDSDRRGRSRGPRISRALPQRGGLPRRDRDRRSRGPGFVCRREAAPRSRPRRL